MTGIAREWHSIEHHIADILGHPKTSAAAAAASTTQPEEQPMSLAQDLHNVAARLEHVTEEVITGVEQVTAHPETATLIKDVSALIGINPPPGVITAGLAGIRALLAAYAPAQQAPAQ